MQPRAVGEPCVDRGARVVEALAARGGEPDREVADPCRRPEVDGRTTRGNTLSSAAWFTDINACSLPLSAFGINHAAMTLSCRAHWHVACLDPS